MGKKEAPTMLVSARLRFEHRNSEGRLIASNESLKAKSGLKDRLKRLFKID